MTGSTVQARHALATWPAHDVEQMTVPVVALLRIVRGRVAIDTARGGQHGIDLLPGGETRLTSSPGRGKVYLTTRGMRSE
jgi:hypothetical protein